MKLYTAIVVRTIYSRQTKRYNVIANDIYEAEKKVKDKVNGTIYRFLSIAINYNLIR